ncbi:MAG: helix-turn-helix domain-containing protein [Candidatus Marinimicrobia bacterium]|nr:helix-turn-helix domain-containing protein [Candidatus Neomarinimicrobiota bacterium]
MGDTWLEANIKEYENDPEFIAEDLFLDIIESIYAIMDKNEDLNQSKLAEKMGVSRSYISKLFNNRQNMTLETLAKLSIALKSTVEIRFTNPKVLIDKKGRPFHIKANITPKNINNYEKETEKIDRTELARMSLKSEKEEDEGKAFASAA